MKISNTHHKTRSGIIKRNPKKTKKYFAVINTNTQGFVEEGFNQSREKAIEGGWERWLDTTDVDVFSEDEFSEMGNKSSTWKLGWIQTQGYRLEESIEPFEKEDIEERGY